MSNAIFLKYTLFNEVEALGRIRKVNITSGLEHIRHEEQMTISYETGRKFVIWFSSDQRYNLQKETGDSLN